MLAASWPIGVVVLALLALSAGLGVVFFQQPVRVATSFLVCVLAVAAMVHAGGAWEAAGVVVWLLGAGAGLLLLTTILLLNLTAEETGQRRYSVRRTLGLFVVAWLGAALFAVVTEDTSRTSARGAPSSTTLGVALFDEHGIALALSFGALAAAGIASILVVRRRA